MQKNAEDIISLPIEMNDNIADTKFRLVHVAAQRVRQLSAGARMEVATKSIKDTTIALEESLVGKFKILTGEEANKAKEEFRKREEQARLEEQLSAKEEEIRKELSAYLSNTQGEEESEESQLPAGEEEESPEADDDPSEQSDEPEE